MAFDTAETVNEFTISQAAQRLGASLREARRSRRLTQQGLATAAKIDLATVRGLEGGTGTVGPLTAALNVLDYRFADQPAGIGSGPWIATVRKLAGYSQSALAVRVAVSKPTVIQVEHGRGNLRSFVAILGGLSLSSEIVPSNISSGTRPRLLHGDCRIHLPTLKANSVDSCVTDPPYGLGFMSMDWDEAENVAFTADVWREVYRVLKPGAYLLAFGGTRTSHRLTRAIEEAGFEIRDQIAWLYGQGFPKSMDLAKAIDKKLKSPREVIGRRKASGYNRLQAVHGVQTVHVTEFAETSGEPASVEAAEWTGWGTALKPGMEPIVVARKPLEGTFAENVLRWGVGGLNIGDCRIALPAGDPLRAGVARARRKLKPGHGSGSWGFSAVDRAPGLGRWPANVIHDGGDFVSDALGEAARFFYSPKASTKDRLESKHPTVKPVALLRYLLKLVTPPGGTVLDPFAGTGTTGQAAREEGFAPVLIERDDEYVKDIRRRLGISG